MDQRLLAGLGNLLTDETLWRAHLDPRAPASALGSERLDPLYDALREVLRGSIRAGRVPHGRHWLTSVCDTKGSACLNRSARRASFFDNWVGDPQPSAVEPEAVGRPAARGS